MKKIYKILQNPQDLQNFSKSSKANKICVKSLAKKQFSFDLNQKFIISAMYDHKFIA